MRMSQRAAAVSGLAALAVTFAATAASAHVTANPSTAGPGSYRVAVSNKAPDSSGDDGTARLLGGLGLAAVVGILFGLYGLTRKRAS